MKRQLITHAAVFLLLATAAATARAQNYQTPPARPCARYKRSTASSSPKASRASRRAGATSPSSSSTRAATRRPTERCPVCTGAACPRPRAAGRRGTASRSLDEISAARPLRSLPARTRRRKGAAARRRTRAVCGRVNDVGDASEIPSVSFSRKSRWRFADECDRCQNCRGRGLAPPLRTSLSPSPCSRSCRRR